VDWYVSRKKTLDGAGLDPAVVPGALHAALTVLEKWGTMSFEKSPRRESATPRTASRCATAPRRRSSGS
jgi:gamma-glutamyltranspeptidase/glutathione hydrolase